MADDEKRSAEAGRLGPLVRSEALRVQAEDVVHADPARLAEGWERRFVVEAARVPDLIRLYESLGFEAVADPLRAGQLDDRCTDCRALLLQNFHMIYTRRPKPAGAR